MKLNLLVPVLLFSTIGTFAQGNNGLVAHWNFNGSANDMSGHNLNGITTNVISTTGYNGIANTAYQFNGTNSHIDVAYNNLLDLDSLSICVLLKPTGFYSGLCQANTIVARGSESSLDGFELAFGDNPYDNDCNIYTLNHEVFDVNVHADLKPLQTSEYANSDTITLNTWYCITTTYKNDSVKLYIDGSLKFTLYYHDNYVAGNDNLGIGYYPYGAIGGSPFWFNGAIDDIRIYNRPLSAAEVVQYCDTAKMLPTSVPVVSNYIPEITIAPNPAHNSVSISLPDNTGTINIQVINSIGQMIAEIKPSSSPVNLDIGMLPAGLYILKAECNGQTIFRKIMKE